MFQKIYKKIHWTAMTTPIEVVTRLLCWVSSRTLRVNDVTSSYYTIMSEFMCLAASFQEFTRAADTIAMNHGHTLSDFQEMREFFNELLRHCAQDMGAQFLGDEPQVFTVVPSSGDWIVRSRARMRTFSRSYYQMYSAMPLHQQQNLCRLVGSVLQFAEMLERRFEGEYVEEISDVVAFGHSLLDGSTPVFRAPDTYVAREVVPAHSAD